MFRIQMRIRATKRGYKKALEDTRYLEIKDE